MNQLDLFTVLPSHQKNDVADLRIVEGLSFVENYISEIEHNEIVTAIDREEWLGDLKRRVQHYGYKYNYRSKSIDYDMYIGELPDWSLKICEKLVNDKLIKYMPDQIIVNEYLPGQGIANHIDCEPCFNDTIISLSLISSCIMDVCEKDNPTNKLELLLPKSSLVVLTGDARYKWTHGIPGRKIDVFKGERITRLRRISLTFRKVILDESSSSCIF